MSQVSEERLHVRVLLLEQIKRIFTRIPLSWCADVAVRMERSFNNHAFVKSYNKSYQDDIFRLNYSEPLYRVLSQLKRTMQCNITSIPWYESVDGVLLIEEFECDDNVLTIPGDYRAILTSRLHDLYPNDELSIRVGLTLFRVDRADPMYHLCTSNHSTQLVQSNQLVQSTQLAQLVQSSQSIINITHCIAYDISDIPKGINIVDIREYGIDSHIRSCESFISLICDKDKLNNIASMSLYLLDPMANDKIKKEIELRRMQSSEGEFSTKYECKKCGGKETRLIEMQSRGSDELVTLFRQCIRCGNKVN